METSDNGKKFIKKHEGLRLTAYRDVAGYGTIGYGHLLLPTDSYKIITLQIAEHLFEHDVEMTQHCVISNITVPLTQYEFDALVSFVFNIGCGNFKTSTMLRLLNAGQKELAGEEFKRWNKAGGKVVQGLVKRRSDEATLFKTGAYL